MNAFERQAEMAKPAFERRREAAAEKRKQRTTAPDVLTPLEKALEDRNTLARSYRAAVRKEEGELLVRLLQGPDAAEVKRFMSFMRVMKLTDGDRFLDFIHHSTWLEKEPKDVRRQILHIIGRTIYRMREREGLPPFDDAIFDEELTVFDRIKELLA
jgi:hypothetical protein